MTEYYFLCLTVILLGGMMAYIIKADYPRTKIRNIILWIVIIITTITCLSIIFKAWDNICTILYGITLGIFSYAYTKKENLKVFDPYFINGYILALVFIFYGILETLNKYLY